MRTKKPFELPHGAHPSPVDPRDAIHDASKHYDRVAGMPVARPTWHENQHKVGICTDISGVQNAELANGRPQGYYSPEFGYLMQKIHDGDFIEGSSISSFLWVAKNIGFLPSSEWTYTTEADRSLPYDQYLAKILLALPNIEALKAKCVDKLTGYTRVQGNLGDSRVIQDAIDSSRAGILTRYDVGPEWYTAPDGTISWDAAKINPIRKPSTVISGHAINMYPLANQLSNTWGDTWCLSGNADITYAPTEAWVPLYGVPVTKFQFKSTMKYGDNSVDIMKMQQLLQKLGYFPAIYACTGLYLEDTRKAVLAFQKDNCNLSAYEKFILRGTLAGTKTLIALNSKM